MIEGSISLEDKDIDYEKRIENFAKDTLQEVELKSKMLGITMNQVSNATNIRK